MAPMTRSTAPRADGMQPPAGQRYREASWQFVGPERRVERELSEEPTSSYGEDAEMMSPEDEDDSKSRQLLGPEDHEDILHPLREAANRVGREVEKFAEVLDSYNPKASESQEESYDRVIALLGHYHGIAQDTVKQLRERHGSDVARDTDRPQKKAGLKWRENFRGLKIAQDESEFFDEEDEEDGRDGQSPIHEYQTTVDDLKRWEQEAQTWDLLRRLVELRYQPQESKSKPARKSLHKYSSGRDLWEDFLERDDLAFERKTVLDWLKDTAEESGKDIDDLVQDLQQNADRGDIIAHGWLHTKAAIKSFKRLSTSSKALDPTSAEVNGVLLTSTKTAPMVSQLDPDSSTRQNRKLQAQDEYFERAIWLGCYELLRRGRTPADIREWCMERTEIWRAVSMSGLPDEADETAEAADPASWALWRRMSFALAHNGGQNEYERAVYGILSGDISSVEPVSRSWNDFIFIHYNALLRSQFDTYLQGVRTHPAIPASISNFGVFDAVQSAGEASNASKRLIENLKSDPRTRKEASQQMKMIQGVLIADDFKDFIYHQGLALSKFANANGPSNVIPIEEDPPGELNAYLAMEDHDSLRVFVHVLLVFMGLGVDLGGIWRQTAVENIIVSYVSFLRLAGKEELIPLYCSQLSGPRRYAILSRNLIDVTGYEERIMQIKLMRELGLNVQEFVKMQARYLLQDYPDDADDYPASGQFKIIDDMPAEKVSRRKIKEDFITDIMPPVSRIDTLLIRSFEWYMLVDGLWSETFTIGSMLYLRFFKHMHLASAHLLMTKVPSAYIAANKTKALLGRSVDFSGLEGPEDEDSTEVIDTSEQSKLLRQHLVNEAKSFRDLEALAASLEFLETARGMEYLITEGDLDPANLSHARRELSRHFKGPMRQAIHSLLHRWLLTFPNEDYEVEFKRLREAYIPETLLAYIIALQFAGSSLTRDYAMECMDLAAVIADEDSDLLPLFEKTGRMPELVQAFAFASKNLLIITSEKKEPTSRSKNTRITGWKHDLWNVKP